jgi:hypothetical protein
MNVATAPAKRDELKGLSELVQLVLQGAEANQRPDLVRRLTRATARVDVNAATGECATSVASTLVQALQSLEIDLRTRRAALRDPGRTARLVAEMRHAEGRLRQFQERSGEWPRALGDALSAAASDIEFDARARLRALLEEGDGSDRVEREDRGRGRTLVARMLLPPRPMPALKRCGPSRREWADVLRRRWSCRLRCRRPSSRSYHQKSSSGSPPSVRMLRPGGAEQLFVTQKAVGRARHADPQAAAAMVTSPSPAGQSAWGNSDDAPATRGRLRDRADAMTERSWETFDAAISAVQPAAESLLSVLTDLSSVSDEIAVEFAVELSAEAGAFIATLSSAAHFKIALTWRRPNADQSQPGPSMSMPPTGARSDQAVPGSR